jgi:hypothetical protein
MSGASHNPNRQTPKQQARNKPPVATPLPQPMPGPQPSPTPHPTSDAPFVVVANDASRPSAKRVRAKSSSSGLVIGAILAVMALAIAGGVYFAMQPAVANNVAKKSAPSDPPPAKDPAPAAPPKVDTSLPSTPPGKVSDKANNTVVAKPSTDSENESVEASKESDSESEVSRFRNVEVKPGGATDMDEPPPTPTKPIGGSNQPPGESGGDESSLDNALDTSEQELVDAMMVIYQDKKLLDKKSYPAIRKLFADRFAKVYKTEIREGLGETADEAVAWLDEHASVKEELFTAILPQSDNVTKVMANFEKLRKEFPKKIEDYAELAIACSVVWDDPDRGVYNYAGHSRRTGSNMPNKLAEMADVFRYYVDAEKYMEGRIRYAPWEILAYVVNDRTPIEERNWAMNGYAGQRAMYGRCYSEVPYDTIMLKTGSRECRLGGKDYTLPNIKQYGGVCAMQADFAARVGKGIGIPAAYVSGESAGGELHAWVMWVELKQATPTGLVFSLESHGRYRGDKYYVGSLNDAQTGQPLTDRQLELRLQTVGLDVVAKRQTGLVMKVWPQIRDKAALDVAGSVRLLGDVVKACPGNEAAWSAIAEIAKENAGNKRYAKLFDGALNKLFATFVRVPDYTLELFDDLAAFQKESSPRIKLYSRLVELYEQAGRPDLACEARLKLAAIQVDAGKKLEAINGLAFTVAKFPSEGRYVPRLLDQIERLGENEKGADAAIVALYKDILSRVKQMRGSDPSPWAIKLYDRGISAFQKHGQTALAQAAIAQQENIRSGRGTPDQGDDS